MREIDDGSGPERGCDIVQGLQSLIVDEIKKYHDKLRKGGGEPSGPDLRGAVRKSRMPEALLAQYLTLNG